MREREKNEDKIEITHLLKNKKKIKNHVLAFFIFSKMLDLFSKIGKEMEEKNGIYILLYLLVEVKIRVEEPYLPTPVD